MPSASCYTRFHLSSSLLPVSFSAPCCAVCPCHVSAERSGGSGRGLQRIVSVSVGAEQELSSAAGARQEGATQTQSGETIYQSAGSTVLPLGMIACYRYPRPVSKLLTCDQLCSLTHVFSDLSRVQGDTGGHVCKVSCACVRTCACVRDLQVYSRGLAVSSVQLRDRFSSCNGSLDVFLIGTVAETDRTCSQEV